MQSLSKHINTLTVSIHFFLVIIIPWFALFLYMCVPSSTTTVSYTTLLFFPGPPGSAGARRELLDFVVQGKINRDRHTDHPAGRHSIRTNQCAPPPSPHVRPILEYNSVVWSPCLKCEIEEVEKVQRHFTKKLKGLKTSSYHSDRLYRLGLLDD